MMTGWSRREFLAGMSRLGVGASLASGLWALAGREASAAEAAGDHAARYWHAAQGGVQCDLCPRGELLAAGQTGFCRVRRNPGAPGLVTCAYDRPCVLNIDPIEKNPLSHVLPGAQMLSVAHAGCNLRCLYCQNWQYSQASPRETRNIRDFTRAGAVASARKRKLRGVTFTYTEPVTQAEFVGDLAALADAQGLAPTLCTCGYVQPKPLGDLLKHFRAVTVTYKGPTEAFYKEVCAASLKPVLDAMLLVKAHKKWLEVATLVVPTHNDDDQSLRTMAAWIVRNLGPQTPWHLERFVPMYKLTRLPQTPQATLEKARRIGLAEGLQFVYLSNLAPHEGNHTYCPKCKHPVILRLGFKVLEDRLRGGRCPKCNHPLQGVWS